MDKNYTQYIDFLFDDEIKNLLETDKKSFVSVIPKGIQGVDELMQVYFDKLNLASYFGGNWDALNEILIDFDWVNAKNITIIHQDIPRLLLVDKNILIKVLGRAVKKMREGHKTSILPTGKHKLQVIFPKSCQEKLEKGQL